MSEEISAEEVSVEAVEAVDAAEEAPAVDVLAEIVQQRKVELGQIEDPSVSAESAEAAEEEGTEEAAEEEQAPAEEAPDRPGKKLLQLISREKELRESREAFDAEREEHQATMAEYQQAQRSAALNPIAYLKTLGLEQENLESLAKDIYLDALGEDAPDEYKGEQKFRNLQREIAELKRELKGEGKQKKQEAQPDVNKAYNTYVNQMADAITSVDVDEYPTIGRVIDAYGDTTVLSDMINVANQHGNANPTGRPLTATQAFNAVEEAYRERIEKLAPAQKTAAPGKKPAVTNTLRNKDTSVRQATTALKYSDDPDAYNARRRREVFAKYGLE